MKRYIEPERENHYLQAYHSFIQHKTPEIAYNSKIIISNRFNTKISLKYLILSIQVILNQFNHRPIGNQIVMFNGREVYDDSLSLTLHETICALQLHYKIMASFFMIYVENSCGVGLQVLTKITLKLAM